MFGSFFAVLDFRYRDGGCVVFPMISVIRKKFGTWRGLDTLGGDMQWSVREL